MEYPHMKNGMLFSIICRGKLGWLWVNWMGGQMGYMSFGPNWHLSSSTSIGNGRDGFSLDFDHLSDLVQPSNIYIFVILICNFITFT